VHRLSWNNSWSLQLDSLAHVAKDWALAIDWVSEGVDDSSQDLVSNGYINNCSCSFDDISFLDISIVTKDDNTDVVSLEVKSHSTDSGFEFHHLTCLDLGETEDSGDTITDGND